MGTAGTVVTLLASGSLLAVTPAATAVGTACSDVVLIGARGSGETGNGGDRHLGPEVKALYDGLLPELTKRGLTLTSISVPYTAADTKVLLPTVSDVPWLFAGGGVALRYKSVHLDPFIASINEGIKFMAGSVATMAVQCPKARFVLAGYSQGAMVAHKVLLQLKTDLLKKIVATALIADGDKVKLSGAIQVGSSPYGTAQGIRTGTTLGARDVPAAVASSTYDICQAGDLVCNFKLASYVKSAVWLRTLAAFNVAKDIHTDSYKVKGSSLVTNVGLRIAKRFPPKASLGVITTTLPAGTVGVRYSATLSATGGTAPFTWSVPAGLLPSGLSLAADGRIAGTPLTPGSANFTVAVRDSAGATDTAALTLGTTEAAIKAASISTSAGYFTSCAVTTSGGVKCWGNNVVGELGDGTHSNSATPVDVVGLGSGVVAVAVGEFHACAVTVTGGVKCWGNNVVGELGDGTHSNSATPVDVVGLGSGVVSISAGSFHSCAVTLAGAVKCWGFNQSGELGDGTTTSSATPVDVVGLGPGVAALTAGAYRHSCALTIAGGVKCWGENVSGELGDGTRSNSATPVDVVGLGSGVVAVSAGVGTTCAVSSNGGAKCWGNNFEGALGDGTTISSATPVDVVGLRSSVAEISAGGSHSCAVTTSGSAKCWGTNTNGGGLGDGTAADHYSTTPVDVVGLGSGVAQISAGEFYSCAVTTAGAAKCWGDNRDGQLGNGNLTDAATPVAVIGLP